MATQATLLLTDVVDSTQLTERLGDAAMAEVWAQHDHLARELLPQHNGREIDKTDGFLLLFDEVRDALAYALAYHQAIAPLDLQARAGLHVGPVILRENPAHQVARGAKPLELEGIAKATGARVMSLAQGGQTLLSEHARAALGDATGAWEVVSHGHWRLKGVSDPVELFEVGIPGLAPMKPPPDAAKAWRVVDVDGAWQPLRAVPHHLPAERDSFVGRTEDLQDLTVRLDGGARLISVIGMGGTGKTRLVTHYAWTWLGSWPGGAWFCDLAEARSVDGIVYAVARALDVPLGQEDPVVQLGHALAGRGRCLVILDNFEQVAAFAQDTIGRWLDRARDAQFLVTTREVLGLRGEQAMALAPLVPEDGVELFMERAEAARRGFRASAGERRDIADLVRLLDGLPLAIELAAARVRVLPVAQILDRMSDRFRLLANSGRRKDRQATLRTAIDWSWELLAPWEQAALAQCSVFEGGFTLESAEAVLDLSTWPDAPWAMDLVQALVDKSLIHRETDGRFGLLVSIYEYAGEKLRTAGSFPGSGPESEAATWARHAAHFAEHGTDAAVDALRSHGGTQAMHALVAELDNLVVACRRSCASGDGDTAAALLRAAWQVLALRGPMALGVALAEAVLGAATLGAASRAQAALVEGAANDFGGRSDLAEACLQTALASARDAGDPRCEAWALVALGDMLYRQGRMDDALRQLDAGLALGRRLGDRMVEIDALRILGSVAEQRGQLDQAQAHGEASLALARQVGDRRAEAHCLDAVAAVHACQGRWEEAREAFEQAVVVCQEVGDRRGEGTAVGNLGEVDLSQGRLDEAWEHNDRALSLFREFGDPQGEGYFLGNLGVLHMHAGRLAAGRAALEAGEATLRQTGGRYLLGLLLGRRAELEVAAGDRAAARAALSEAEAIVQEVGCGPDSEPGQLIAQVRAQLEQGLG